MFQTTDQILSNQVPYHTKRHGSTQALKNFSTSGPCRFFLTLVEATNFLVIIFAMKTFGCVYVHTYEKCISTHICIYII